MLDLVLALFGLGAQPQPSPIGQCDPVAGPRVEFSKADRERVFDRIEASCLAAGDSPIICAYFDMVTFRESRGRASVRHTRAEGENGLGPLGLSLRWQRHRWPGEADPDFCTPEVSYAVAREVAIKAIAHYHAQSVLDIQAVYSGRWRCFETQKGRECYADPSDHTVAITCPGMKRRGFSCNTAIGRKALGKRIPKRDRLAFVEGLMAKAPTRPVAVP